MTAIRNRHGTATVTLPSDLEIVITRQFDAPAALVFKACTTPELVKRWWGFPSHEWKVCDIDLRVGGKWRYLVNDKSYGDIGFHGEYSEIDTPHRVVTTEVFEGFPDAAALNTITYEEKDGVTTMTTVVLHQKKEHRDGHINSGMEGGMQISMNRLEDLVGELEKAA